MLRGLPPTAERAALYVIHVAIAATMTAICRASLAVRNRLERKLFRASLSIRPAIEEQLLDVIGSRHRHQGEIVRIGGRASPCACGDRSDLLSGFPRPPCTSVLLHDDGPTVRDRS